MKFGYEGLGLFYTLLEKIGKQEKPIKTEVLKTQLKVGKRLNKVWDFLEEIGLVSSSNGETFNEQLLNFSEKYQIKKEKTREKVAEWRKKQADTESVTSYVPVSNPPKVKESKVNKIKEREIVFTQSVRAFDYPKDMLDKFISYWTEPNTSGTKMLFELRPTWDTKRRLKTWADRTETEDKPKARAGF